MKFDQRTILLFLILTPLITLASGGYVLTALSIDFILFFILLFLIIKAPLKIEGRVILFVIYITSVTTLFYVIGKVDYLDNLAMINLSSLLFPPTVVYLTYLGIKNRFKKT